MARKIAFTPAGLDVSLCVPISDARPVAAAAAQRPQEVGGTLTTCSGSAYDCGFAAYAELWNVGGYPTTFWRTAPFRQSGNMQCGARVRLRRSSAPSRWPARRPSVLMLLAGSDPRSLRKRCSTLD